MKTPNNNNGQSEQKSWAQQNEEAANSAAESDRKITDGVSQSGMFDKDAPRNPASQIEPTGTIDVGAEDKQEKQFPGYVPYPKNEDIYAHDKLEEDIDPETRLPKAEVEAIEDLEKDVDLDVPGAELDDADEAIGREDEENNYYSLGGDNHEDLEEDRNEVQ
jgi:ssDNA-binding Zn-finger/Zn-ribbon topoisomerase 1